MSTSDRDKSAQRLLKELEGWPDISAFLDLYRDRLDVERDYDEAGSIQHYQFSPDEIATRRQRANLLLLVDQFEEIFADEVVTKEGTRRLVELVSPDLGGLCKGQAREARLHDCNDAKRAFRSLGAFPILPELFNERKTT